MKHYIVLFFIFSTPLFGQVVSKNRYRQAFSIKTNSILNKLDSIMCPDTLPKCEGEMESRLIGENSTISESYLQYAELVKVATEKELLAILDNPNEKSAIRGYALMAYVYKCDKEKKLEKHFNYRFNTMIQVGCIGSIYSYQALYHRIRVRNFYDPNPRHFVMDPKEQEVIKQENKIRQEQGEPLRKEE